MSVSVSEEVSGSASRSTDGDNSFLMMELVNGAVLLLTEVGGSALVSTEIVEHILLLVGVKTKPEFIKEGSERAEKCSSCSCLILE